MLILAALPAIVGCGADDGYERVPITGILTVQDQPLPGAIVQFLPPDGSIAPGALGTSDEEGVFEVISSRQGDEGVPPGEYTVRVSKLINPDGTAVPPTAPEADYPDARESVPRPYNGPGSPLKVTISDAGGEITVDIPEPLKEFKQ